MVQVLVAQETSRPSLCWALLCQACRLAQALGLHRRSDPSQFRDEDEREERKWVFWNLYIMDKTMSMAFGRTVCMPDFDIDVDPPKETEEIFWPMMMAWIALAKIQSRIYEYLYSAVANRTGDEKRHTIALALDQELRLWWSENVPYLLQGSDEHLELAYVELELRFNFYNSLLMIHRVDHNGGVESQQICLHSARQAIVSIRNAISKNSGLEKSNLVLWWAGVLVARGGEA